jgi:hypothetical protein
MTDVRSAPRSEPLLRRATGPLPGLHDLPDDGGWLLPAPAGPDRTTSPEDVGPRPGTVPAPGGYGPPL